MENKVEYCIGIGMNMLFPEYHVFYLEDEDNTIRDSEPEVMSNSNLELEDA